MRIRSPIKSERDSNDAEQRNSNKNIVAPLNAAEDRQRLWRYLTSSVIRPRLRQPALARRAGREAQGQIEAIGLPLVLPQHPLEDLAKFASEIGLKGIDLLNDPNDWPIVKKYGLIPTMTSGAGTIPDACNRKDLHDKLEKEFQTNIPSETENVVLHVITILVK